MTFVLSTIIFVLCAKSLDTVIISRRVSRSSAIESPIRIVILLDFFLI